VELGERFRKRFEALKARCPLVHEVRVKGVMIGLELTVDGAPVVRSCLERRLLVNCTHTTVIRLLPALTLTDAECDEGCSILEDVILHLKS
jgi:acetylornithine/succinyldiaminopimelate/putrescine aminotransferase